MGALPKMFSDETNPESWLPELRAVLTALGVALHGRQPTSETIAEVGPRLSDLVPGYVTTLRYKSRAENRLQHNASVDVEIVGPRLNAKWGIPKAAPKRVV